MHFNEGHVPKQGTVLVSFSFPTTKKSWGTKTISGSTVGGGGVTIIIILTTLTHNYACLINAHGVSK